MSADGRGGHPFGDQARRESGDLEKRLENLVLWGKVEERDEKAVKVRVRFGEPDDDYTILSPWLPIGEPSWYQTRGYRLPDVDEWVVVLSSSGHVENGIVLCSIPYRNEPKDKGFVAAAKDGEVYRTIWGKVKLLADLLKHCFHTFNRKKAELWHYLKDEGSFRWEIGKNANTNTCFHVKDGEIEMRVGTTKISLTNDGIKAYYSGNAVSVTLDKNGVTVGLREEPSFAEVPSDKYEGTEGEPEGEGVVSVNDVEETTIRIRNGQIDVRMDDKLQVVATPDSIVSTIKEEGETKAQHIVNKERVEATLFDGEASTTSLVLTRTDAGLELLTAGGESMRVTIDSAAGLPGVTLASGLGRMVLSSELMSLLMDGVSLTWTPGGWVAVSPSYSWLEEFSPGVPYAQKYSPTDGAEIDDHPDTTPPDNLERPDIDLGVKPFTPEM